MRELCAGINVDIGTAAAFREQWRREAQGTEDSRYHGTPMPLLLKTDLAAGDAVVMTAAIHSLHRTHPGKYLTAVESKYPEVYEHSPDVVPASSIPEAMSLHMHYPAIHNSNRRGIHFMQGWCEFLGTALGISVPLETNRPLIYFPDSTPPVEDYWLISSGVKKDFTNKRWGHHRYSAVVNELAGKIRFVQVGESKEDHPRLHGADYLVGRTNLRQLFDLVRRARGVVCGVSLLMHLAAALDRPAIVIAGGREPVQWNAYPKQHYLHTIGALPCVTPQEEGGGGCWRSRTIMLGDSAFLDKDLCLHPCGTMVEPVPKCMTLISPAAVSELVLRYDRQYGITY